MTVYYKSLRIIDGKPSAAINERKKRMKKKNRICCKCGTRETYIDPSGRERWHNHLCDKENCTESLCYTCGNEYYRRSTGTPSNRDIRVDHSKTVCRRCEGNDTILKSNGRPLCSKCYSEIKNNLPGSYSNIIKLMSQSRNSKLSKYSETGEGIIVEAVVAKVRKIRLSAIELDSFRAKFDLFYDEEYGIIQVKGPTFEYGKMRWGAIFGIDHNFDVLFIVCMSINRKNIERIYIIPEHELYGERRIQIYEDFSKLSTVSKYEWVEKFRFDEKTKNTYDVEYQDLMNYLRDKEFFGIEDIKRWLESDL